jgi:hypothetical protein
MGAGFVIAGLMPSTGTSIADDIRNPSCVERSNGPKDVHLKRCSECAREIDESATTCDACADWAASLVGPTAGTAASTAIQEPSIGAPATPTAAAGGHRRELLIAVAAVMGAALLTFALLFSRSGPSSNVSAAAPAAIVPRQPSKANSSAGVDLQKWSTDNRAYWLGHQRHGAAFELPSNNLVQTWFGPVRPTLVVRCMSRTTQAFVYTGSPMKIEPHAEGKTVTVSVDDEPVRTERWPDSDNHDALFAPDGALFAQRLLHAQTLRFGYSPHNANDVVAQFHVSGLSELIDPVMKECGWTK